MANPKKNTYLQLQEARKYIAQLITDKEILKGFTIQQCLDIAQIALNTDFGFGAERNAKFADAFHRTFIEYAKMCVEDGADDPEIIYTKEKLDRMMRCACGEQTKPFDERYAIENLYFRDKLKEAN